MNTQKITSMKEIEYLNLITALKMKLITWIEFIERWAAI